MEYCPWSISSTSPGLPPSESNESQDATRKTKIVLSALLLSRLSTEFSFPNLIT
jgi:hypothetical protein